MTAILIALPFAAVLAVLTWAAHRRRPAAPAAAFRPQAPAETRYAVTVLPDPGPERQPFAFDAGLIVGERDS